MAENVWHHDLFNRKDEVVEYTNTPAEKKAQTLLELSTPPTRLTTFWGDTPAPLGVRSSVADAARVTDCTSHSRNVKKISMRVSLPYAQRESTDAVTLAIGRTMLSLVWGTGKEFSHHQQSDQALGIQTYFADPYSSWRWGSNENFNGLLSQYVPKKRVLSMVTQEESSMIENRLNYRPRKRLGFTPYEVFHASLKRVAVLA